MSESPDMGDVGGPPHAGGAAGLAGERITVVIPAHNEATRIETVVRAIVAQGLPVLVVDDGSTDGTADEARAAGARVLALRPNRGKGEALKEGFRQVLSETSADPALEAPTIANRRPASDGGRDRPGEERTAGSRGILTLDGDGQHDPGQIPAFVETWKTSGADLVVGVRDYRAMPPIRWFTNSVSRRLFSWALGEWIPDNQSGYRLRSHRLAKASLASQEQGFAFEVEEIAICVGRGYQIAWVPIKTIYGTEVSDIRPWTHFISFLRVTWRARGRVEKERRGSPRM